MTVNVPNAYIQTAVPEPKERQNRIIIKITGVLVDYLLEIAPEIYRP